MAYYDDYAEPPPPPPDGYFGAPEEPAEPVPMFDARGRPVAPERASEIYRLRMSTAAMAERVSDARTALDRARTEAEEGVGARALDATGGGTMAIPSVDWDSLPITEGAVMMKGQGGFFSGRGWRDRYMHLERGPSLIIADNERMTNILREVPLTPNTSVALGDDSIAHRNSRVKFTFTIFPADESEPVELNVEDEGVRAVWVQAINEIIATEAEAQRVRHAMAERGDMGYGASGEGGDEFAGIGEPIDSGEDERRAAEEEAAQYFAYGQGVSEALRGEEAEFTVEMRDDTGLANPMGSDPSALSVILESEHLRLDLTPESLGDGSFLCTYTPAREGEYELSIKVRGQHINDSPFAVAVGAAPTAPSHCLVTGDAAEPSLLAADAIILSGDSAGGIGVWPNLDYLAERYPEARVVGAPIAGFYFFADPYTGPGHTSSGLADFREAAWPQHAQLWHSFVDEDCAKAHPTWFCVLANNTFPYISSEAYATQSFSDQVVLTAHDWVPSDFTPHDETYAYVKDWSQNMTIATSPLVASQGSRGGVFGAACFIHTSFSHTSPLINGKNFFQSFGDWYFKRVTGASVNNIDDCGIFCNPTCQQPSS